MKEIHPTAIVHPKAVIGDGVRIGPYCVVGENVSIGPETDLMSHVVLDGWTEIGEKCRIFPFATIGTIPQDLKFKGEESKVRIGSRNTIREFVTINRGTSGGAGVTVVGDDNLLMAYVHLAHDCEIGSHVIIANTTGLAGHIQVHDYAVIGGLVGIHQFVRIGRHAIVGGCSGVPQDIPPFVNASGNRIQLYGINVIGLKRHGFSEERINVLKKVYRILFRSNMGIKEAVKQVREEYPESADVREMVEFIESSERGICR